jgi:hypothetical protein
MVRLKRIPPDAILRSNACARQLQRHPELNPERDSSPPETRLELETQTSGAARIGLIP